MEPTHVKKISKQIEFIDKHGKKRTRTVTLWGRSKESEEIAEKTRLGVFASTPETKDPRIHEFLGKKQLVLVTSAFFAKIIIKTCLLENKGLYKFLSGQDVLRHYLDQDGSASQSLLDGFSTFERLFVFFGYYEAKNKYLPSLIVQLVGQRYHSNQHVWLFMPRTLKGMALKWDPVIQELDYLPLLQVESLSDQNDTIVRTQIVQEPLLQKDGIKNTENFVDPKSDSKFQRKKKKWKD